MADNKSCEGKETLSAGTITVDIDCADALKGLKAVQREAKKATADLRELESIRSDGDMAELISNLYPITYEDAKTILDSIMEGHTDSLISVIKSKRDTAALKELEDEKLIFADMIKGFKNATKTIEQLETDEVTKGRNISLPACRRCGSSNVEIEEVTADEKVVALNKTCNDCGWG